MLTFFSVWTFQLTEEHNEELREIREGYEIKLKEIEKVILLCLLYFKMINHLFLLHLFLLVLVWHWACGGHYFDIDLTLFEKTLTIESLNGWVQAPMSLENWKADHSINQSILFKASKAHESNWSSWNRNFTLV